MKGQILLDFDSTFVAVEALDELGSIALRDVPDRDRRMAEIERLTALAMAGKMAFGESLDARLALFAPRAEHISELVSQLHGQVTPSMVEMKSWFRSHCDSIYIVSGGFREYIVPVVREYGIAADHVLANKFTFGPDGEVAGFDQTTPSAHGKTAAIAGLQLPGPIVMVGDGYTDWLVRAKGIADIFVAYTENVDRPAVSLRADIVAKSFQRVTGLVQFDASGTRV